MWNNFYKCVSCTNGVMDDDELSGAETDEEWVQEAQHTIDMLNDRLDALEQRIAEEDTRLSVFHESQQH